MAERIDEPEAGPQDIPTQDSPAAVAIALGRAAGSLGAKEVDAEVVSFLRKQSRLIDLQTEHLHEQRELQVRYLGHQEKHLRLRYFGDRLRVGLQLLTILIGLAVVIILGSMAWQAHQDHGVVIEAFTVPPDLAARGLTGQVMASKVLDRLSQMQTDTSTGRPAKSYANDWAGDIKVAIPETGVSLGELNRALRQWLGRETHITGELVRTHAGLELTARAGLKPGEAFTGQDADLDGLIQKAAESVYHQTQPYRWAAWLQTHGRPEQAKAEFERLALSGSKEDQPWAYVAWASDLANEADPAAAADKARAAIRLDPRTPNAYLQLGIAEEGLGHHEAALSAGRKALALTPPGDPRYSGVRYWFLNARMDPKAALEAAGGINDLVSRAEVGPFQDAQRMAGQLADMHDVSGARRVLEQAQVQAESPTAAALVRAINDVETLDDWTGAATDLQAYLATGAGTIPLRVRSTLAMATARLGRVAEAEALIAPTPLDCYYCIRERGEIASVRHDWAEADRWFAEAVRQAPSSPEALISWAQSLLDRGDPQGAIGKFKQAHDVAPHFADPLELWGEALVRTGDMQGAVAKFAEADPYAPRWGRNHTRWGEALMLSGHYRDARAQYAAANGMDLSRADRAALDVLLACTASGPLHG
jgi:tetratricopeptide (TPR) repeat protein